MDRDVWCQLTNMVVSLNDEVANIGDFRDALFAAHPQILSGIRPSQVKVYRSREAYRQRRQPLDFLLSVDGLGLDQDNPLVVEIEEAPTFDEVLTRRHLVRDRLLGMIDRMLLARTFTSLFLISPRASGKTSLLESYIRRNETDNCIYISFLQTSSAIDLLRSHGLDFIRQRSALSADGIPIIIIDDAQAKYGDLDFWRLLDQVSTLWLPLNVRFIISATYAPEKLGTNNVIGQNEFVLSDDEAREVLTLSSRGLPGVTSTGRNNFVELVVRECGGLIGALRESAKLVAHHFAKDSPSEAELCEYYLSTDCLEQMGRCFGGKGAFPTSPETLGLLAKCLALSPRALQLDSDLARANMESVKSLKKSGILVPERENAVRLSSPLLERYCSRKLFPKRAPSDPGSLDELVAKVISSMSASVLQGSVARADDFPKKATFQHLFMQGLALNTHHTTSICPELSRIFPSADQTTTGSQSITGEIDFFVHIPRRHRWGIELLVSGRRVGEHVARIGAGGRYSPLAMTSSVVIDFRATETGIPTQIVLMNERVTVFFKLGDFSTCQCIFGLQPEPHTIPLMT